MWPGMERSGEEHPRLRGEQGKGSVGSRGDEHGLKDDEIILVVQEQMRLRENTKGDPKILA